jgi:predicted alpha/beta superfamily hydrolase
MLTAWFAVSFVVVEDLFAEVISVEFVVTTKQPVAKEDVLYLAGNTDSLGNWQPNGSALTRKTDTSFEGAVELTIGQAIEFKVTRGTWETVEKDADGEELSNRTVTIKQGEEIVVEVEAWADQQIRRDASSVVGTLEIRRIASIEPSRLVRVWLPPGYHESTQSYAVLYMLDGQNVFDRATSAIGEEWGVDETLTKLNEANLAPSMIVVAVDNSYDRVDEYTPMPDETGGRKRGGNADLFAKWLVEELKPQIDREYRTLVERKTTWICGSSLGGLFSLYSVIQFNETFGGAIVMSPSVGWGNEAMNRWIESTQSQVTKATRVWLDFGGREGIREDSAKENTERFARLQANLESIAKKQNPNIALGGGLFPEGKHQESAWRERFPAAIQFVAAP